MKAVIMRQPNLALHVGVKTDPIEYRFSYQWLFRLLAEEGVEHVQGEKYPLDDVDGS